MTAYSTFCTCEICPNCNELNDNPAYGKLVSRDLKMDTSEEAP